eukprot:TRINITY_DN29130_c0_g1_i1.p1 TRINITY_DN29130_c0_g1~~TRINITY_DN29130_c0_g1_i1.p1  ORF type:complete len:263 (+),score=20.26 TRINITY_DN29130_c0_g1_i1:211-999(+)
MKDTCLILYHVGKSAGRFLWAWFNYMGLRLWTRYGRLSSLNTPPPSGFSPSVSFLEADVYMGHWSPGVKSFLELHGMNRTCYEFTILRDPLERTLSNVFYSNPGISLDGIVHLLRHPDVENRDHEMYFDHACRQFSGLEPTWDRFDPTYGRRWNGTCNLLLAKAALNELDFVGFVEDLERLLLKLREVLGAPRLPGRNTSARLVATRWQRDRSSADLGSFGELAPVIRRFIRMANRHDQILYAWARVKFTEAKSDTIEALNL